MSRFCTYCFQEDELSDMFISESHPYEDNVVNKCIKCNQWSKNTEEELTEALPENLRTGEWQQ